MSHIIKSITVLEGLNEEDLRSHFSELLTLSITISTKLREIDPVLNISTVKCIDLNAVDEATKKYHKLKSEVSQTLRKLEKVHNEVQFIHAHYVDINRTTGINVIRDTRTAAVNCEGFPALTTQAALDSLLDSLQRNNEFQLKQICDINLSKDGQDDALCLLSKKQDLIQNDIMPTSSLVPTSCSGDDYRMGGLGRSRGRRAVFNINKVRGMYDDVDEDADSCASNDESSLVVSGIPEQQQQQQKEASKIRRDGIVCLSPRLGGDGGFLCYVQDVADDQRRACALRTLVDIQGALSGLGIDTNCEAAVDTIRHACTYVIGARKQKWAMLGGEVDGLNGETAIAVRLTVSTPVQQQDGGATNSSPNLDQFQAPPLGSFRRHCNVCKQPYIHLHPFYHQLCVRCGDFNLEKRLQTSNLEGCVCLVTGGRVRIGYQICLKLLRAGATVIATTRWPKDAALRYSHEHDFNTWCHRLRIDELELSDPEKVEEYCQGLLDGINGRQKLERLHVLINNAAQTITRPSHWFVKMKQMEVESLPLLKFTALSLITNGIPVGSESTLTENDHDSGIPVSDSGSRRTVVLDESGQPLDLSGVNSWSRRLVDVPREELIHTMNVNAVAPFIFMRKLKAILTPTHSMSTESSAGGCSSSSGSNSSSSSSSSSSASSLVSRSNASLSGAPILHRAGLVVNVTALEGKFNVGKKSSGHPHTNMAKAALNMLTLTCAREWARSAVYVSSVDTGWVTDMAPGGVGASSLAHETFIGPPLDDEDGAARVLDPVFSYANSQGDIKMFGHFYKDYMKASW